MSPKKPKADRGGKGVRKPPLAAPASVETKMGVGAGGKDKDGREGSSLAAQQPKDHPGLMLGLTIAMTVLGFIVLVYTVLSYNRDDDTGTDPVVSMYSMVPTDSITVRVFRLMEHKQYGTADSLSQELTIRDPVNSDYWYTRGLVKLHLGDANAADTAMATSVRLDPIDPRKQIGLACTKLRRAIDTRRTDSVASEVLINTADSLLVHARVSLSGCPELYINKGIVEGLRGFELSANAFFDTALQKDPTHPSLERYRERKAAKLRRAAQEASL